MPSFRSAATTPGVGTACVATAPAGKVNGDRLIAIVQRDLVGVSSAPAGWSVLLDRDGVNLDPVIIYQAEVGQGGIGAGDASWQWNLNVSDEWQITILCYSDTVGAITQVAGSTTNPTAVTQYTTPALTPAANGSMVVYGVTYDTSASGRTHTTNGGAGHTERVDATETVAWLVCAVYDVAAGTADTVSQTITMSPATADQMEGFALVLPPGAGGQTFNEDVTVSAAATVQVSDTLQAAGNEDVTVAAAASTSVADALAGVEDLAATVAATVQVDDTLQPAGTLDFFTVGGARETSIEVHAKVANATSAVARCATDSGLTANVVDSAPGNPDGNGWITFTVTGLTGDTNYFVGIRVDGTPHDTGKVGQFKTSPPPGTPGNFTFAHSSCINSIATATATLNEIRGLDLAFFALMGDFDYGDHTTESAMRSEWNTRLGITAMARFVREHSFEYCYSDHDFGGNNSNGTFSNKAARSRVASDYFASRDVGDPTTDGARYRSWMWRRVLFVFPDERYYMSPQTDPEGAGKVKWGAAQRSWFADELQDAYDLGCRVVVIFHDSPWHDTAAPNSDDHWVAYQTERQTIADLIEASPMLAAVHAAGDMHALGAADATAGIDYTTGGNAQTPTVVWQAAALHQTGSSKGGPYLLSQTGATSQVSQGAQRYGRCDVTDDAQTITLSWEGRIGGQGAIAIPTDGNPFVFTVQTAADEELELTATATVQADDALVHAEDLAAAAVATVEADDAVDAGEDLTVACAATVAVDDRGFQRVLPDSTVSAGGWTPVGAPSLPEAIDDAGAASFADHARSSPEPAADAAVVRLAVFPEPGGAVADGDVTVPITYDKEGPATVTLTYALWQDHQGGAGQLIATATDADVTDAAEAGVLALTAAEYALITFTGGQADDLDLVLTADVP